MRLLPTPLLPTPLLRFAGRRTLAEAAAVAWELFSALLFISAVLPAALASPVTPAIFVGTLALSAVLARCLPARSHALAAAVRAASWPLAVLPLLHTSGRRVVVAALIFGLMAAVMRRAIYRLLLEPPANALDDRELGESLQSRLIESGSVAGIVGGHVMLLFSVAFLRTHSQVNLETWLFIVPTLAVPATFGFAVAVRLRSVAVVQALAAGAEGDQALLARGLGQALALPSMLAYLDFVLWFACTGVGVFYLRPGPVAWQVGDAVVDLAFALLFSWGVAFYQRAFHRDTVAPAVDRLRRWTRAQAMPEPMGLRTRLLRDFGLPLLFTALLWLLSTIGLYRALGSEIAVREDGNAVVALVAAFAVLVLAVGGVMARAARDLSLPLIQLAQAADRVAHGELVAAVPRLAGPVEVVGLGESVERMRDRLARTILELEEERASLEAKVLARTAALRHALDELRRTQAALIQGERLASIGELVAGVAHEIYNPLSAIAGASVPLSELAPELRLVLDAYREAETELPPARRSELEAMRNRLDLDASIEDLAGISALIRRAVDRSVKIVQNLRSFSRVSGEPIPADLHAGLEETLMLLGPRLSHAQIEVTRVFADLPQVTCRAGEMNQVFMNLLVNAIQAIEAHGEGRGKGALRIETGVEGSMAIIRVSDTGPGIPTEIQQRIFDPFFTTKPRGQGTGLGLSISTDIVRRHGGSLALERSVAGGACFVCRIPLEP